MKWLKVWLVIGLLVGSLVPAGLSLADEGTNTEPLPPEMENVTQEQIIAEHIVDALTKLSSMADGIMANITLPENSTIMEHYELATQYKEEALKAYDEGDYYNTIINGLTAMHHYRVMLQSMKERRSELREDLPAEVRRMEGYFRMAERIISKAQEQGIDVGNAPELLNQTKEAYRTVLEDIKAKDFAKAKEDIEKARELKAQLDDALRGIREELAYANADKIVNAFLERGAKGIEVAQEVIAKANETGANVTELQERLDAFQAVYDEVKGMADEGNYTGALDVMKENREAIGEFYKAMEFIKRKAHEREVQERMKDVKKFLREMYGRLTKDGKALRELHRKGVDTRRAELQLRTAMQEFRFGVELLKRGRPMEAKAHFAIALDLTHRVEEFILWHG
ncbi:hypothetical protein [Palaeococcus ferrophilus]|uniref:hypothetical protein n=1 Tax=Palaeococcus ferrophilus TaxID=83868 RepID=UPI00064EE917|nr:hypothetical protein [Palaeococcus ferrophilus]